MSEEPYLLSDDAGLPSDVRYALDALARVVERRSDELRVSILLLTADGQRVLDCAGPSLPVEYRNAIHGLPIGEGAGSCGTAAYRNARVVVSDISRSPLWAPYRHLALRHGLAACWSEPIRSPAGTVLGTFAMYYSEPRVPSDAELQIIEAAATRAGVMLERPRHGAARAELVADLAS